MRHQKILTVVAAISLAALAACMPTRTSKSVGETVDDATITTKVKAALAGDDKTSAIRTNVETYRGNVQLNGFAESATEKAEAARVARSVEGVKRVDNNLKVDSSKRTAGEYIDDKVIVTKVRA